MHYKNYILISKILLMKMGFEKTNFMYDYWFFNLK